MNINIEEKLEVVEDIQYGSLVFVNVFPKDVLYSPFGIIPVIRTYVTYGYKNIDDFFNTYTVNNVVQEIKSNKGNHPITGFVVGVYNFSIKRPHYTYSLCKMYKIIPEGRTDSYWFPDKDVYLCTEKSIKELELLETGFLMPNTNIKL